MKFTLKDLKKAPENRPVVTNHVERLKRLIEKYGYLKSMPIIVNPEGVIIDGQHRYEACKQLSIEPPIVIEEKADMAPILNANQMNWKSTDYVNYYAEKGFQDYILLQNMCKAKNISPNIAYLIITGKTSPKTGYQRLAGGSSISEHPIRMGTFKFPEHTAKYFEKLNRKADSILNLIDIMKLPRTDRLIAAICALTGDPRFSFDTMIDKIEYQRAKIYRCTTIADYKNMLLNIYNYKNSKKLIV